MMMNNLSELMVTIWKLAARGVAVALISLPAIPTALGGDDSQLSFSVGIFVTDWDSETRLDASSGPMGTPVDLETDLGVDTSDSAFRIDGYYRINDKHRIDFSAFDLSRTGNKQLVKEINWQGTIFPISASVNSDIDLNIYKIAYTYSILRREKGYLGLSAGLYIADVGTRVSAENIAKREGGDATAPLPVVGLRGEYQIAEKWSFRASGEIFALDYQGFDGSLIDLYAGIEYQLFEHAAIGLGVNSVSIDVEIERNDLSADLDWRYDGGLLFVKFDF
jgi:hypothetical protein